MNAPSGLGHGTLGSEPVLPPEMFAVISAVDVAIIAPRAAQAAPYMAVVALP